MACRCPSLIEMDSKTHFQIIPKLFGFSSMLRLLSLAVLCLSSVSAVELLGRAELDACLVRMETMTSEKKMTHLGAAWNELKPHERVPILKSIAMLEEAEADPEEISYIANLNDDAPAEKAHCACPAVVAPPVCCYRSKGNSHTAS